MEHAEVTQEAGVVLQNMPAEVLEAQRTWTTNNWIALEYIGLVTGDVAHAVSAAKPDFGEEREVFRAFTRSQRLKRDCPFPPEPDLV